MMKQGMKPPEEKLFRKLSRKAGSTIREQEMLKEGDRLLLGLSGGKDSMILLEILADRLKSFPFHVDLFVVHVVPEGIGYQVNVDFLSEFCRQFGYELIIKKIKPEIEGSDKAPCFLCSWERRKVIFNLTRELDCNKLAFGHHRDDALQTFMMNMLYHGSISSMPYSLKMFEGRVHLVRPLLDIWEKDLEEYAGYRNYSMVEKQCPYDEKTRRKYVSDLIGRLEKDYPKARINMFRALDNIYSEYLPSGQKKLKDNTGQVM